MRQRNIILVLLGLCPLLLLLGIWWQLRLTQANFFLAPMLNLDDCLLASRKTAPSRQPDWLTGCTGLHASAAHLLESTLKGLQAEPSIQPRWQLGYTLKISLLALLQPDQNDWRVNMEAIDKVVQTIHDNPRPLIVYLFSTHFGVNAPIEPVLAQDPDNLAHTPAGPLPVDTYYGQAIYPWSVARTDNAITHYRSKVIDALLQKLCLLPAGSRSQIKGITLLGEVHQLFPDFESGMGFDRPYNVTDYSAASVAGFRQYLQQRYRSIEVLNHQLQSGYPSWESIAPPGKNIRKQALARFEEHMDGYAAGQIPISGWVHVPGVAGTVPVVKIYLNGKLVADAPVHLGRQDVRTALPKLPTANVGWRHDLDYSHLPAGIHRIDLALSEPGQHLVHLGTRSVSIMNKQQSPPTAWPSSALPGMRPLPPDMLASIDQPIDQESYFFNPLAYEWQMFRQTQVVRYLQYFNTLVGQSCFSNTPRYTHQIVPQFNPSWDSGKYATALSLMPMQALRTGISMYGETSYGLSVTNWFKHQPPQIYGVTEFHPLESMNPERLGAVIYQHQNQGAAFLSFFLETRWQGQRISTFPNPFSFDPQNQQFGSVQLFASTKALLSKP